MMNSRFAAPVPAIATVVLSAPAFARPNAFQNVRRAFTNSILGRSMTTRLRFNENPLRKTIEFLAEGGDIARVAGRLAVAKQP